MAEGLARIAERWLHHVAQAGARRHWSLNATVP